MQKFKRQADSVLEFLHNNYKPFNELMILTLLRSEKALRVLNINHGEEFVLRGGSIPDYLYVIQGEVEIEKNNNSDRLNAMENLGSFYLFPPNNGFLKINAVTDSTIVQVNSEMLMDMLSWDQLARQSGLFTNEEDELSLERIRNTKAFKQLPLEAIEEIFKRFERIKVSSGTDVVTQGDKGDAYYIILRGEAEVWQQGLYDDEQKLVNKIGNGDAFGEEALVLKGTRSATIKMITDGVLLKLDQKDFDELIATPMIDLIKPEIADVMLKNGAQLLDVRYEEEFDDTYIPGAKLIPLPELRGRINELDEKQKYLVVCAAGKRASVGALLLKQSKIKDVIVIDGGMRDWPFDTASNY